MYEQHEQQQESPDTKQASGGGGKDEIEIKDSKPGNSATAKAKFVDDEGKEIKVEDPSKIQWHAVPAGALGLKPDPKNPGTVKIKAVEGTEGSFQVTATEPESGKSAVGTITVKSSKPKSTIEFSAGGGDDDEDEDDGKGKKK